MEVAFEGLQRSTRHKSGVAMRFPRISRLRWDKPPREADRLETLEKMLRTEARVLGAPAVAALQSRRFVIGSRPWHDRLEDNRRNAAASRFLGGPPLRSLFRLILLCVLVGVILHALGFDPGNIIESIRRMIQAVWDMGFDAVRWVWRYFLLGAIIVIPIWLIVRFMRAPRALIINEIAWLPFGKSIGATDAALLSASA